MSKKSRKSLKKSQSRKQKAGQDQPPFFEIKDIPLCLVRHIDNCSNSIFDEQLSRNLLGGYSLDFGEKLRVVDADISWWQHSELMDVFKEERKRFNHVLYQESPSDILRLHAYAIFTDFMLCRYLGLRLTDQLEAALVERMVKRSLRRAGPSLPRELAKIDWVEAGNIFSWYWKYAMPVNHPAWQIGYPEIHGQYIDEI